MLTGDAPILIVDDDNLVRLGIRMTLEDAGFRNLQVARNGATAIEMALRHHPHLILMDVRRDPVSMALRPPSRSAGAIPVMSFS